MTLVCAVTSEPRSAAVTPLNRNRLVMILVRAKRAPVHGNNCHSSGRSDGNCQSGRVSIFSNALFSVSYDSHNSGTSSALPDAGGRLKVNIRNQQGFTLLDVLFVCGLIGVLAIIALPRLLLAKQAAGAASAIGSMRAIDSAQLTFALTCGQGFYAPKLTTLGVPPLGSAESFISPNLSTADTITRSGYVIKIQGTPFPTAPASCNGLPLGEAAQAFKASADPNEVENRRYFATNADGQIWEHNATLSVVMPEVGEPPVGHVLQ